MQPTLQITFQGISPTEALDSHLRSRIAKLSECYDRILGCQVMVEIAHHHRQGNLYHIRINLKVPGVELVINRNPQEHQEHEDLYVAIRDAFDSAERRLKDYTQRQRGEIKAHEKIV